MFDLELYSNFLEIFSLKISVLISNKFLLLKSLFKINFFLDMPNILSSFLIISFSKKLPIYPVCPIMILDKSSANLNFKFLFNVRLSILINNNIISKTFGLNKYFLLPFNL